MFNKRIKELEIRIEKMNNQIDILYDINTALDNHINRVESNIFNLEYPNGKINIFRDIYFEYALNKSIKLYEKISIEFLKYDQKIEKLSSDSYLITINDELIFLVNTTTNQSIRVDKDMKVVL